MSETPVQDKWGTAKAWYQSKTIIGVIITALGALLSGIFPNWGFDLGSTVADAVETADQLAPQADVTWGAILQIWGIVQAFWGRLKARQTVTL